ncbi:MAG: hypothetical protein KY429_12120 [Actinobacteria bacterium]|nr:hypothetical protein [Actinomycetota bacterium]
MGAQNDSGEIGTAKLQPLGGGQTRVTLGLNNAPQNPQPAHIHRGTCEDLDPQPLYPLSDVVNGISETVVDVSIEDLLAEPHAVNVHKSKEEAEVYFSCGNIADEQP